MGSHRDLDVWQIGMELAEKIYRSTEKLPKQEQYGLTSQLRRAAVSVVSNIAEGAARRSTKEYVHFLYCSLGSSVEIETQLELIQRLDYLEESDLHQVMELQARVSKMLYGLIKKLKSNDKRQKG